MSPSIYIHLSCSMQTSTCLKLDYASLSNISEKTIHVSLIETKLGKLPLEQQNKWSGTALRKVWKPCSLIDVGDSSANCLIVRTRQRNFQQLSRMNFLGISQMVHLHENSDLGFKSLTNTIQIIAWLNNILNHMRLLLRSSLSPPLLIYIIILLY